MTTNYNEKYAKLNEMGKNIILEQNNKLIDKPKIIYQGFIGDKAIIKPYSNNKIGFMLDDKDMYKEFISKIENSAIRDFNTDINIIQSFMDNYFVGNEKEVEEVYNENQDIHSIKKYQNRGGQCIHKSALANNFLQILGYDCDMIWSNIGSENHAFIIIHYNDKHYLYDPTNRSKLYINSTEYYKIPTLVEKTSQEIQEFYNNGKNLSITTEDEITKNQKQNNPNVKIELPKLEYSCRNKTEYQSTVENERKIYVIDEYVNNLRKKGLSAEEIEIVLTRIKKEALNNVVPKVESLKEVYEIFKGKESSAKKNR